MACVYGRERRDDGFAPRIVHKGRDRMMIRPDTVTLPSAPYSAALRVRRHRDRVVLSDFSCFLDRTLDFGFVTRKNQTNRFTIENLTHDCLDVRFLRRQAFFGEGWIAVGGSVKWPRIAQMRIARYRLILDLRGHTVPQQIRISWTRVHLGGERPWMHCPHCQTRVARLYAGPGGYFCRRCIGNPPYASQQLSAQGRAHFQACKLRLLLDGQAQLSMPFPERPPRMHRQTYERLKREGTRLEAGLSRRMRRRLPDYSSLVAYTD
jgi:hypothetical protein